MRRFRVQKPKNDGRPWKTVGRRESAVSAFYGGIKLLLNDAHKVLLAASSPLRPSHLPLGQDANRPGPPTRQEAASCRAKSPFHPVTSHPSSPLSFPSHLSSPSFSIYLSASTDLNRQFLPASECHWRRNVFFTAEKLLRVNQREI